MRRIRFYLRTLMADYGDRHNQKLTQQEISAATGISQSTISAIVNNKQSRVDLSVLERLCAFFKCELSDLMRLEEVTDEYHIK